MGIAVVSFVSSYATTTVGDYLTTSVPSSSSGLVGPQVPILSEGVSGVMTGIGVVNTGNSLISNVNPNSNSLMGSIINFRNTSSSHLYQESVIDSEFNFKGLIRE